MATVSIHIEGHEDGTLDDPADLAVALRYIAEQLMSGEAGVHNGDDVPLPADVVQPYQSPFGDDDPDDLATWTVQYGIY